MTMLKRSLACLVLSIGSFAGFNATLLADNWGHWRGESGSGISSTANPPMKWSPTKNIRWQVTIPGRGSGSPIVYFYKGKSGLLTCVDAKTGKPFYSAARVPGLNSIYASPIAAGGYVYLTDRSGTITVIKDSDKLEVVSTNKLNEGVDASPAPVNKQLFIRSENTLYCIE